MAAAKSSDEWREGNSYRNLVSCCIDCNRRKGDMAAPDFLRVLYRKERLTSAELDGRLRGLKALAAGKLRPSFALTETTGKSVKKEASENQPHPCMKKKPQGWATQKLSRD